MKHYFKRFMSCLLAMILVFTSVPACYASAMVGDTAEGTEKIPIKEIIFEDSTIFENTNGWYQSIEGTDMTFFEYSESSICPNYTVVFSDGTEYYYNSSEEERNECIVYDGNVYYLELSTDQSETNPWKPGEHMVFVTIEGIEGFQTSFTVNILESPVESVVFEASKVFQYTCGTQEYDEENGEINWYRYYESDICPDSTILLKDGTVIKSTGRWFEYEGEEYRMTFDSNQSYDNQWGIGQHKVEATVLGYATSFTVDIIKCPIKNISFAKKEIVQGSHGYTDFDYNENEEKVYWYRYSYDSICPSYTITMEDGTFIESNQSWFTYNGRDYDLEFDSDQRYDNPWGVGEHEVNVSIMGYESSFKVNIVGTPIESIEFETDTVDVIKGTNGYKEWNYDDNNQKVYWYYYSLSRIVPDYTIKMSDGSTITSSSASFEYNGIEYELDLDGKQNLKNAWDIGKHEVQVNIMGYETSFNVNIVESPIKSISFDKKEIIKGTHGYEDWDWNNNDEKVYWYHYTLYNLVPEYTITMNDGTTIMPDDEYFEYQGVEYELDLDSNQRYDNPWGIGTHQVQVSVMGHESSFTVTIVDTPIQSITFDSVEVEAYTNGRYAYDYGDDDEDEEIRWYKYDIESILPSWTMTLKNGDVINGYGTEFCYNGASYELELSSNQEYSNPWEEGRHEVEVEILGYQTTFPVTIDESQIASVKFLNIEELVEHEKGHFEDDIFYYDFPEFSFEVTKKDGTKFICFSNSESDYCLDRSADLWTVGTNNKITLTYGGCTADGYVTIKADSDIQYVEQNGAAYITGYKGNETSLSIPSEIDGLPVKGILSFDNNTVETLIIPDSVETIAPFEKNHSLKNVNIGKCVKNLDGETFKACYYLENINVFEGNSNYESIKGIVYDETMTTLVAFPPGRTGNVVIPATVTNIDILKEFLTKDLTISFAAGSKGFVTVDDVTYSADMKKVIYCNTEKEGSVVIPDTVETILDGAFRGCSKLTDVTVSNKVTAIVYETFANCKNLTNVTMPDSITAIDEYAFYNCGSLQSVDLPAELVEIGTSAFASSNLTALDLPQKVTRINGKAFYSNQIGSLSIPNSVTYLGDSVFTGNQIESIDIPDSVTYLGAYAFSANDELTTANIGKGVSQLRNNTFSSCDNLTTVNLENSQVVIWESVFANTSLKDINFDHIAGYGRYAFAKTKLEKLPAMDSVASITYGAFYDCADLSDITLSGNVKDVSGHSFDGTKWYETQNKGVTYLNHVLYDYKGDAAVSSEVTVKGGTKVIADAAFEETYGLENVFLPDTLEHIGEAAFYGCTDLEEIIIPTNVTEIESRAFSGCKKLMKLSVAADNAFYKSDKNVLYNKAGTELIWCGPQENKTFEVPVTVKVIKNNSFADSSVTDIVISNRETEFELTYRSAPPQWKNFILHCYEDSKVYNFAMENGLNVVLLKECEHSWATEYTVDKAATCTETGSKSIRCTLCNEQDESTITTIPATHTWNKDYTVDKASTCTTAGSKSIHCNECSATKDVTAIDKLAHKEAIVAGKAATCTATGLTSGKQCTVCKTVTVKQTTIAKLAHNYNTTLTKATTSKDGKIVKKCSCGYVGSTTTIKKASKISLSKSAYTYTGKVIKAPTITVKDSAGKTISSKYYTVSKPSGRKAIGKYTYTVKFKGNYSGTKKLTLTIKPVKPTIQTPKAAKKAITVKWKKGSKSQVTGYEVMVATNSKFSKNKKTATVKGYSKTSYKMTKLKAKTKYYVKVRSYKTVKGVKIYSDWSKVKTIKTK